MVQICPSPVGLLRCRAGVGLDLLETSTVQPKVGCQLGEPINVVWPSLHPALGGGTVLPWGPLGTKAQRGSGPGCIHSYTVRKEQGWDQCVLRGLPATLPTGQQPPPGRQAGYPSVGSQGERAMESESHHGTAPWPGLLGAEHPPGPPVSLGLGSFTWEMEPSPPPTGWCASWRDPAGLSRGCGARHLAVLQGSPTPAQVVLGRQGLRA